MDHVKHKLFIFLTELVLSREVVPQYTLQIVLLHSVAKHVRILFKITVACNIIKSTL
jgi:hypothetical protein